jgi:hypothetical protein
LIDQSIKVARKSPLVIRIFYRNYGWEIDPLGAAVTGEMDDIVGSSDG